MAIKLNYIIPESNFEKVRDRIASIIKTELDNQAVLRGSINAPNQDYKAAVFTERFTPVAHNEGNVITVDVSGGPLDNQTPISQSFECVYNIDIFTSSKENANNTGYYNSAVKLQRLAGLVRHILQSPSYDKLDFASGFIERRSVSKIQFAVVSDEQDAAFTRMGRVLLAVRMNETSNEIEPVTASGYYTHIKIAETEKGFLLTYNNE